MQSKLIQDCHSGLMLQMNLQLLELHSKHPLLALSNNERYRHTTKDRDRVKVVSDDSSRSKVHGFEPVTSRLDGSGVKATQV